MQANKWITGLAAAMLLCTMAGCSPQAAPGPGDGGDNKYRYGVKGTNLGPGTQQINVPQWDGKQIDVDGDGDREHLSGRNNIGNPSVDLRSFATPGGGADHTKGIYPHTFTADRIADLAHSVDGVQNARAIIAGTTAIIGLNLDRGVNAQRQAAITQFVRQRVLVQAPEFRRVHITSDKAQTRRIQRIADEMRAGHSLTMFNDDISELTRTIPAIGPSSMPAVPGANAQESRTWR